MFKGRVSSDHLLIHFHKVAQFLMPSGGSDVVDELLSDEILSKNKNAVAGLTDIKTILEFCEDLEISETVSYHWMFL